MNKGSCWKRLEIWQVSQSKKHVTATPLDHNKVWHLASLMHLVDRGLNKITKFTFELKMQIILK
jgi:hypothetical protein